MMENSFQGDHNLRKVMCGELFKEIISKIHVIRTRLDFPWTEIEPTQISLISVVSHNLNNDSRSKKRIMPRN